MNVVCPSCRVELRVRDSLAGRRVKCPHCAELITVEDPEPPAELLEFEDVSAEDDEDFAPASTSASANHTTCPMCGAKNRSAAHECYACGEPLAADASLSGRVWQDRQQLVMRQGSSLPYRCIKTNESAEVLLHRKLHWHHPALYVVLVFSPLIYIILALLLRKKAEVEIPVCTRIQQRRRTKIVAAWIFGLAAIGMLVAGFTLGSQGPGTDYWIGIGALGMLACLIALIVSVQLASLVTAAKISEKYVWIKGAHPDYLAELPEWPGERDDRGELRRRR